MITTTIETTEKQKIMAALWRFINQRSGIEAANYFSDWRDERGIYAFKSEQRSIARDGKEARILWDAVDCRDWINAEDLKDCFLASFSGRLEWDGKSLSYTSGQYFPTEYRKAVCAVLSRAIVNAFRREGNSLDYVRKCFQRSGASRWFN
jgi:hypothetical protein